MRRLDYPKRLWLRFAARAGLRVPSLTVAHRVAILSAIPLVGFAGVFVLFTLGERQVADQIALSRLHIQTALTIKNLRDQITGAQIAVAAFLVDPNTTTKAKALDARDAANGAAAKLVADGNSGSAIKIPASISKGLKTVSFDVDTIVRVQEAIGYDAASGLAGSMAASLDKLQSVLKDTINYSDPVAASLSQDYVGLSRDELRFALSRSDTDRAAFATSAAIMQKDAEATMMSDQVKSQIKAAIDTAAHAFASWADAVQRVILAQATASSHFRDLSLTADNVVSASSRSADQAQAKLGEIQARVSTLVASVIAAIVALCCVFCYVIGRGISRPIRQLAGLMRRMADGDLDVVVPVRRGRDEMADISAAVLAFQDGARQKQRLEAEAARTQAEAERERANREEEKAADALRDRMVVDALGSGLGAMSRGDLLIRIDTPFAPESEKLRLDFNDTVQNLRDTIGVISTNTGAIQARSENVAAAAIDLSRRTEQQAASLERTAASLDEITATVRSTADHADRARSVVAIATSSARASGDVVRQAIAAMNGIEGSSKKIGQIIGVIDEIAFQTNLLALNAGVEAARAGEAGRGFAVVASEVRALAQRSAEAAKSIKQLISASKRQVDEGVDLVGEAGQALERIVADVAEVNAAVSAIAVSAAEQAHSLDEVNTAIAAIDQITKKNAAMVEETTATMDAMAAETKELSGLVARFKTGAKASPASPARARPSRETGSPARRSSRNLALATDAAPEPWDEF